MQLKVFALKRGWFSLLNFFDLWLIIKYLLVLFPNPSSTLDLIFFSFTLIRQINWVAYELVKWSGLRRLLIPFLLVCSKYDALLIIHCSAITLMNFEWEFVLFASLHSTWDMLLISCLLRSDYEKREVRLFESGLTSCRHYCKNKLLK